MPVIEVKSVKQTDNQLRLDASASYDPEGKPLSFLWRLGEELVEGPELAVDYALLQEMPLLLTVGDGVAIVADVVTYDPLTNRPVYTPDKLKCENMEIVTAGKSALNPEIDLGPTPRGGYCPADRCGKETQPKLPPRIRF